MLSLCFKSKCLLCFKSKCLQLISKFQRQHIQEFFFWCHGDAFTCPDSSNVDLQQLRSCPSLVAVCSSPNITLSTFILIVQPFLLCRPCDLCTTTSRVLHRADYWIPFCWSARRDAVFSPEWCQLPVLLLDLQNPKSLCWGFPPNLSVITLQKLPTSWWCGFQYINSNK